MQTSYATILDPLFELQPVLIEDGGTSTSVRFAHMNDSPRRSASQALGRCGQEGRTLRFCNVS
jgi:hypothetical protein